MEIRLQNLLKQSGVGITVENWGCVHSLMKITMILKKWPTFELMRRKANWGFTDTLQVNFVNLVLIRPTRKENQMLGYLEVGRVEGAFKNF